MILPAFLTRPLFNGFGGGTSSPMLGREARACAIAFRGGLAIAPVLGLLTTLASANNYTASPSLIAPSGYFIFYDDQAALSFESATHWELPKNVVDAGVVSGQSCAYELSVPLSLTFQATSISGVYGKNGYQKVLGRILKAHPNIMGVYDVKIDTHKISVLGFFTRKCLVVTARSFKPGAIQ